MLAECVRPGVLSTPEPSASPSPALRVVELPRLNEDGGRACKNPACHRSLALISKSNRMYCSSKCRLAHFRAGHALLAPAPNTYQVKCAYHYCETVITNTEGASNEKRFCCSTHRTAQHKIDNPKATADHRRKSRKKAAEQKKAAKLLTTPDIEGPVIVES